MTAISNGSTGDRLHAEGSKLLIVSIGALGLAAFGFIALMVWFLYQVNLDHEKEHLLETVIRSGAAIESGHGVPDRQAGDSVADAGQDHPAHPVPDAHDHPEEETHVDAVDVVVGAFSDGYAIFRHSHIGAAGLRDSQVRVPLDGVGAEPFRRARQGHTGVIEALDHFGESALAAYTPLAGGDRVVVAFKPLHDIRLAYLQAVVWIVVVGTLFVLAAAFAIRFQVGSLFRRLEERESQVRSTVNNIRDMFLIVDRDWHITFANKRAEKMLQRRVDDMSGKSVWDELPELASQFYRPLTKAMQSQKFVSAEGLYPPADKWFEVRAYPNADGMAIYVLDITELRRQKERLQKAEARFRNIVEGSIQGITVHQDKHIVYANEAYAQMHGYTVDEIVGMSVLDLIWPEDLALFHSRNRARDNGERVTDRYQMRARCKDGSPKWIEALARVVEHNGQPATQATIIDVSERKAAEEALQKQSELARLLKDIAVSVNEAESVVAALQAALEKICQYMKWPVGHAYLVQASDSGSARSSGAWYARDRKRYTEISRVSGELCFAPGIGAAGRVLRDGRPVCDVDIDGDLSDPRSRTAGAAGLTAYSVYPILAGGDVVGLLEFFHDRASQADAAVVRNISVVGTQLGRVIERERSQWALADSERRFKDFAEVASDWFWEMGPDLRFTYFSERFFDLFGLRPENVYGLTPKHMVAKARWATMDADEESRVARHLDDLRSHREFRDFEFVAARPGDGVSHISISGTPVFDKDGQFAGYRGTAADISERKQVENRMRSTLRHQEVINSVLRLSMEDSPLDRKLEQALELIHSADWLSIEPRGGIFLFDEDSEQLVLRAQRNLPDEILTNCAKVELGQCLCGRVAANRELIHAAHVDDRHETTFAGMEDHGHYAVPILSRDQVLGVLILYVPAGHDADDSEITFLEAIATTLASMIESERRDGEREHLEGLLLQSQKMEAIGTLAGGVAHDINNTLVPILGLTELIMEDVPEDDENRESLEIIHDSAQRTKNLVNQILSFSRKDTPERTAQDVKAIVGRSIALLRSTVPSTITIDASLGDGSLVALVDATQIQQVVLNLTTNAVQSMDSFGTLTVTTEEIAVGLEQLARCPDLLPGPHARIVVRDTGCGMDNETMSRIFDPFYTTKDVGEGTGLGLSVVHGIVSSHGGGICVSSQLGEGTEFQVFIPLATDLPNADTADKALAS